MSWVKLDDGFAVHRKVRRAGPEAMALFVALLCYCARHATDGWVREDELDEAWPWGGIKLRPTADRLVEVGLLERDGDRFLVHDFLEYNESRADRSARKQAAADRARASRQRKTEGVTAHVQSTSSVTHSARTPHVPSTVSAHVRVADASTSHGADERTSQGDGPEIRPTTVTPPRPVPSRPVPSLSRREGDARDADLAASENGRWALWLRWKAENGKPDDPPTFRDAVERTWQAFDRELGAKHGVHPVEGWERTSRAYLQLPDDRRLGGKPVAADRRATHLAANVHEMAAIALGNVAPGSSERLLAEAERHRQQRIAAGGSA